MVPAAAKFLILSDKKTLWKIAVTAITIVIVISTSIGPGCTGHNLQVYVQDTLSVDFFPYISPVNEKMEGQNLNAPLIYASYITLFDNLRYHLRRDFVMRTLTSCFYSTSTKTVTRTDANGNQTTEKIKVYRAVENTDEVFQNIEGSFHISISGNERLYIQNLSQILLNSSAMALSESAYLLEPAAITYCAQYEIPQFVPLVLAVIQQESGGLGTDPMQCSESPYNTRYPQRPNAITNADYSIQIGVKYLASCLRAANVRSIDDIPGISLALQGYNFGNGFIDWALERGGYSRSTAEEFSREKARQMGWSGYGDVDYVTHVLRYYTGQIIGIGITNGSNFYPPVQPGQYKITSGFGERTDPIGGGSESHKGVDFAASAGTPIFASENGTVIYAQFGTAAYGGYGNIAVIRHSASIVTMYAHCSRLLVQSGQTVQKGQIIAHVGSTGSSTGNHCHYEIRVNNKSVDPIPYLSK